MKKKLNEALMYNELIKRLRNRRICIQQSGSLDDFPLLGEAADAIAALTASDVRPVVLCKDCVYAYPYGLEIKCTKHSGKAEKFGENASYSEFHDLDWFCADAKERRTNERN